MNGRLIPLAVAALLVGTACASHAVPVAPVARAASDGRLMPPERVTDHVWVMRQPDRLWAAVIGNVVIIEQATGVVLIDSGGSTADGREIVAAVARLTPKPITAIAITHWHNDHPLGVAGVRERFPNVRVIATAATAEFMKTELKTGIGKVDPTLDEARRGRSLDTIKQFEAEAAKPDASTALRAICD